MHTLLRSFAFIFISCLISGCSLPRGGPPTSSILSTFKKKIITVDEIQAQQLNKESIEKQQEFIQKNLYELEQPVAIEDPRIEIGDKLVVTLMSYSPDVIINENQEPLSIGFNKRDLGTFTVDQSGNINLPYIGELHVSKLTEKSARALLQSKYNNTNIVSDPYVLLNLEENGRSGITVTGDVGVPKILMWQPGGIKLATALTLAQSGNTRIINNDTNKSNSNITMVSILRSGKQYSIPYDIALKRDINLAPSDKIVVKSSPQVRATVIGGGIVQSGIYDYSIEPSLLDVIAKAGGFNANNADISSIFVFRKTIDNNLKIYRFGFRDGSGMAAATFFPIADRDVIYTPEAKIVPWLRVLNIAFQMALPAAIIK